MGKLVLIRHGQSMWNLKNIFTGWVDVPLSAEGIEEAVRAGKELAGVGFDIVYVSTLVRAMETAMLVLAGNNSGKTPAVMHDSGKMSEWGRIYSAEAENGILPVYTAWELNERYYGELQGLNKAATAQKYGDEQVRIWRRSYDVPPPNGEALKNTAERTIPYFTGTVMPAVREGKNILISAHGNSLRSIIMHLDHLSNEEVLMLELPTGAPVIYEWTGKGLVKI
ncbi:MAG: 2,3-bisphosphoglycerate-dependent phosphoglycerate mutase [Brevinematales bacterium]|nr:2,3-bisphosphoglycerate-dependent phosphoglycerate mutase [Brevinematales bacterium]